MDSQYNPAQIESKWQAFWLEQKSFCVEKEKRDKFYLLEMFP